MLEHLKVSNVALIEEVAIDFAPGLNIFTGETGAGKSILIDSINFVLGGRVSKEFIRAGANAAVVEVYVAVNHPDVTAQITELGVEIAEDAALLIYRSYNTSGKSTVKINGKPVTIGMLREVAALLIDLHGQHEHQSLLNPAKHIQLLDRFCQDSLEPKTNCLGEFILSYKTLQKNMNNLLNLGEGGQARIEMYNYQMQEIAAAQLMPEEEGKLLDRRKLLLNAEKITQSASAGAALLGGDLGALENVSRALEHAKNVAALDATKENLAAELAVVYAHLEEISRDFSRYAEALEHNPQELEEIESRLDQLYRLKQKYRRDIPQILTYFDEINQELQRIENSQEELAKLAAEKKALEKEIGRTCLEMSKIRRDAAKKLEVQIEAVLKDLGMEAARFAIEIQSRSEFSPRGFDQVFFQISANKGEEPKPLSAIASGGEMSRVMLALKTALAGLDTIETFIFDEIDAGISGRAAQQVAQKMASIAKSNQILCITHLPQIAAMGDANFYIEKISAGERTVTNVQRLSGEGVVSSIARLIGGAEITPTTTKAAKEMRKLAEGYKK